MVAKTPRGVALAMVLLALSLMLLLVVGLNQALINQQRSASNSMDYALAQNYAKAALLAAEATVAKFDIDSTLEQPLISAACPAEGSLASRRYACILNQVKGSYNIVSAGSICNRANHLKGWCFSPLGSGVNPQNYLPAASFQPWTLPIAEAIPCSSYTRSSPGIKLPAIDDKNNNYSIAFQTAESSLCAQPRYMLELINFDFSGRSALALNSSPAMAGEEVGMISQTNGGQVKLYKNGNAALPSGRLYRISVRAFGRNGNTRVTLQEYLAIEAYQSSGRALNDSPDNLAYRIIPLSVRWLH